MELTGTIKLILDEQRFDSGFYKREFVITTEEQYPQDIKFELLKEKSELIRDMNPGDRIKVLFDIRGSEWNNKYFNNLVAWKLEAAGATAPAPEAAGMGDPGPEPFTSNLPELDAEEDDLPF